MTELDTQLGLLAGAASALQQQLAQQQEAAAAAATAAREVRGAVFAGLVKLHTGGWRRKCAVLGGWRESARFAGGWLCCVDPTNSIEPQLTIIHASAPPSS